MTRAASFGLVAVVAMLSLAGSAGSSESAARPFRIIAMSHTHPTGQSYSWVCAKIGKTTSMKAKVTARNDHSVIGTKTIRGKRTRIVRFRITAPGKHTFKVAQGTKTAHKSYVVPPPPDPAIGPFPCA